ncbi:MAG: UvrD-helicase domain-containing protein [Thermoanaerobacteraceae bacterium]|nr:UvrD-helicase domain-containing protein [Thermoanaerobacteraceae bacterium]
MQFVADFHIHSHYSRATSKEAKPEELYRWAVYKGVTVVGTGDFTHPAWREELKSKLEPAEEGLYRLKEELCRQLREAEGPGGPLAVLSPHSPVRFMVSGEISTIYKKGGRVRKIHHLILLPSLQAAEELSHRLEAIGNLASDGRPILGLDGRRLLEITLEVCPRALLIPAHIWTPHFSLLGANSGFDHIEECFEDLTGHICAVETGLSSDPPMNWRLSMLDRFALVSHSDAHSPRHLAREADIFDTELSYEAIYRALAEPGHPGLVGTLEFFPEEGKYHYDGHRACNVRWRPSQTREAGGVCPVCGRKVTVGVLHRVEELADREEGVRPSGVKHYESLVPLPEAMASALGVGVASKQVWQRYFSLLRRLGPELVVLRKVPLEEIEKIGGSLVAEAVRRIRAGEVEVLPGFDGEYGKIILLTPEERGAFPGQAALFEDSCQGAGPGTGGRKKTGRGTMGAPTSRAEAEDRLALSSREHPADVPFPETLPGSATGGRDLLAGLNREQQAAVTAEEGPVIVIAGPGTGKTKTLVHRIAYLLGQRGVAPGQITAVTFTNKAASEIRQRVTELMGDIPGIEALTVGTFHSICMEILRNYRINNRSGAPALDREVTLLDEVDTRTVLEEILKEVPRPGRRDVLKIQRMISFLKSRGLSPLSHGVPEELRVIYKAYQDRMADYGVLDYDDVLLETLKLTKSCTDVYGQRFTHLLVDEFQDVNAVQYELVRLWAGKGRNLFVIGDPDQAIYGFRGADHRFFWKLKEDFPQAQTIRLSLNYRSTPVILRAASAVVGHNTGGPVAVRQGGPKIRHLEVPGEISEGIAIVREIGRLVGGTTMLQAHGQYAGPPGEDGLETPGNLGFGDIAVLFRTSLQGEVLEECFLKEGIPYRVVGRESFLEDRTVRKVLAFFWCVVNPEDDFHLYRLLSTEPWKVSQGELRGIREAGARTGKPAWKIIEENLTGPNPKLLALKENIEVYRSLAAMEPPAALMSRWIEEYEVEAKEPLKRLLRVASGFRDLFSFLRAIGAVREADLERRGENASSSEAVILMTLHAAKGLEFPVVFIAGVEDGLIPLRGREDLPKEALEEERRLFYVGLTRAREVLVLVSALRRTLFGSKTFTEPSPFLLDIPPDCLERKKWAERVPTRSRTRGGACQQLTLF